MNITETFCPIKFPVIQNISPNMKPTHKSVESVTHIMPLYSKQIHVCIALYVSIKSIDTLQYTCRHESPHLHVRMCFSTERHMAGSSWASVQYDLSWKILHHYMKTVYHSMLVSAYQYEGYFGIYVAPFNWCRL